MPQNIPLIENKYFKIEEGGVGFDPTPLQSHGEALPLHKPNVWFVL
jgi:hypothetical protein